MQHILRGLVQRRATSDTHSTWHCEVNISKTITAFQRFKFLILLNFKCRPIILSTKPMMRFNKDKCVLAQSLNAH